jgi:exopolysaccharide production protein ExoY
MTTTLSRSPVLASIKPPDEATKRVLDVVGAVLGIVLTGPVLAICALLIKADDHGPIIYRRRLLGLNGKAFEAYKLRTMHVDADQWLSAHPKLMAEYQRNVKLASDPRVTRVGHFVRKLSLDELPQLWNVLLGEMSLVGPRMIHASELERYGDFGPRRLSVKPGLTGLWQVRGRQDVSYEERIRLDREYVENRSLGWT